MRLNFGKESQAITNERFLNLQESYEQETGAIKNQIPALKTKMENYKITI